MYKNSWLKKLKWQVIMALFSAVLVGPLQKASAQNEKIPFTVEWKDYTFYTPILSDPAIAYLYDIVGQESLMAGETTLVDWKSRLFLTAGGIADVDGKGDSELNEQNRRCNK